MLRRLLGYLQHCVVLQMRQHVPVYPLLGLRRRLDRTPFRRLRKPSVIGHLPGQQAPQDNGRVLWSLQGLEE